MPWPAIVGAIGSAAAGAGSLISGIGSLGSSGGQGFSYHETRDLQREIASHLDFDKASRLKALEEASGVNRLVWMGQQVNPGSIGMGQIQPSRDYQGAGRAFARMGQDIVRGVQAHEALKDGEAARSLMKSKEGYYDALAANVRNQPTQNPTGDENNLQPFMPGSTITKNKVPHMTRTETGSFVKSGIIPRRMWTTEGQRNGHPVFYLEKTEELKQMIEESLISEGRAGVQDAAHIFNAWMKRGIKPYPPPKGMMWKGTWDGGLYLTKTPNIGKPDIPKYETKDWTKMANEAARKVQKGINEYWPW
jgi:hypothetical protein